jgi:hypothetical protein
MYNCLKVDMSYSDAGPWGRMSRVLANSTNHRLATNVARGSGLESVSVRERKRSGDSACRSLRK